MNTNPGSDNIGSSYDHNSYYDPKYINILFLNIGAVDWNLHTPSETGIFPSYFNSIEIPGFDSLGSSTAIIITSP